MPDFFLFKRQIAAVAQCRKAWWKIWSLDKRTRVQAGCTQDQGDTYEAE